MHLLRLIFKIVTVLKWNMRLSTFPLSLLLVLNILIVNY